MPRRFWPTLMRGPLVVAALLVVLGCGGSSVVQIGPTPTPTSTPRPTTCAQIQGLAGATPLTLPHMEFPAGTVAAAPVTVNGGAGQFTIADYYACAPNNTTDLIVNTGKGPEAFTHLLSFYSWDTWPAFPYASAAQQACKNTSCFAFDVDNAQKGLFIGPPVFLALDNVTDNGNGLITFHLRLATPPAEPACGPSFDSADDALYGHHPVYVVITDPSAVQWPPLTRLVGDSTPSTIGEDLCSAGDAGWVMAFMDLQFSSHGAARVACPQDCWTLNGTTYTLNIPSATAWFESIPRHIP
jgi:hypothetical protein